MVSLWQTVIGPYGFLSASTWEMSLGVQLWPLWPVRFDQSFDVWPEAHTLRCGAGQYLESAGSVSELDSQLWLEQGHTEGKVLAFTAVCSGLALLFNDDDLYK